MSFGFSPSDVVKLVEVSTRVYLAFKGMSSTSMILPPFANRFVDANENSEAQVDGLVREFTAFHHCLVELDELMREYGKPLPFPVADFKETLQRCEKCIKPYAENLVDKKMNFAKMVFTIKFMGKEKEIDGLRKQVSGHYQALQMCIAFLQLYVPLSPSFEYHLTCRSRLTLEARRLDHQLLVPVQLRSLRSMSLDESLYATSALAGSSRTAPLALTQSDGEDELYREWQAFRQAFSRQLKNDDDRTDQADTTEHPSQLRTAAIKLRQDPQVVALFNHLQREVEDALAFKENRAKRIAVERRTHLAPSDAIRLEVQNLPKIPQRPWNLDKESSETHSDSGSCIEISESVATVRPERSVPSPSLSPTQRPQAEKSFYFADAELMVWPAPGSPSRSIQRPSSASSQNSSFSTSPGSRPSVESGPNTADTTPDLSSLHHPGFRFSVGSLGTLNLGESAVSWNKLAHKVQVERTKPSTPPRSKECDIHWRYNEDSALVIRSVYRSGASGLAKVWSIQTFPATHRIIPLTTAYPEGDISIDFPQSSFGRLDKRNTDVKYTFTSDTDSRQMQTLLYTNHNRIAAELLYDRCVDTISSNLNKTECRRKNIRLWKKSEEHEGIIADILVLLFYTSVLPEDQARWVEEPHYVFQRLSEDDCKKTSDKLILVFSKDPAKWHKDKLGRRHESSSPYNSTVSPAIETIRRGSDQTISSSPLPTDAIFLGASATGDSVAPVTSTAESRSPFDIQAGDKVHLNKPEYPRYKKLEIKFRSTTDRKDFTDLWQTHFGSSSSRIGFGF